MRQYVRYGDVRDFVTQQPISNIESKVVTFARSLSNSRRKKKATGLISWSTHTMRDNKQVSP